MWRAGILAAALLAASCAAQETVFTLAGSGGSTPQAFLWRAARAARALPDIHVAQTALMKRVGGTGAHCAARCG